MKLTNWKTLNLQSLDIIECEGRSKTSKRIQTFQRFTGASEEEAKISHIAGVCKSAFSQKLLVQESTTLNPWAGKRGVQMNPFEQWLDNYNGEVYIKQLVFERTYRTEITDAAFWDVHKDDDYESGIPGGVELLLCGLRLHRYVRWAFPNYTPAFTSEPHCSELQAKRIDAHELWNRPIAINRMPPWIWRHRINPWFTCKVKPSVRIK